MSTSPSSSARAASLSTRSCMCPLLPDGGQPGPYVLASGRLAAIDEAADGPVVEVTGEAQGDGRPLLLGQPADRRPQCGIGLRLEHAALGQLGHRRRPAAGASVMVDRLVVRDPE